MINEFGEEITDAEIGEIVERVRALSFEQIDRLYYDVGWIDSEKGENLALPDWRIEGILKKPQFARNFIRALLEESVYKEVVEALIRVEKS